MLPVNLDQYSRYVTLDDSELRELNVAEGVLVRLHRLRGMYAYWLQFPSKLDNDLVQYDMTMFKVSRSLASGQGAARQSATDYQGVYALED